MIHQPPAGARDLLPLEVAQKSWINDTLQQVFYRWGYQRIVTSTLERLDTLMAGGAIERSIAIELQDSTEGRLALRPELTASIARTAVTRMKSDIFPQRLCYRANVFRNPPEKDRGRQVEFYQAGVELLFAGGVLADAEILLLLVDCLDCLGLENWQLILGEVGLTRSLLANFPQPLQNKVRHCLANLDRLRLESLPLSPELRERALLLFDLRGKPADVLAQVASLDLDESGREIVSNLKTLLELIEQSLARPLPIVLDLSLLKTFDYYTGIVFDLVSRKDDRLSILGRGGRYDKLLELYHPQGNSAPGIGFSFYIEDLHYSLLNSPQLPAQTPAIDWLIIPKTADDRANAFIYAQKLRNSEKLVRVEVDLGLNSPEEIRSLARTRRILQLAWVESDRPPIIETL